VVDDDVEVVDLLDELLARLLGEPQQELVDHQTMPPKPWALGVLGHALEALAPARVDARVAGGRGPCSSSQLRAKRSRAWIEPPAMASKSSRPPTMLSASRRFQTMSPYSLDLAADLVEDGVDVEELEGRLAAGLSAALKPS
jgi:hypothetical protein